MPYRLPRPLSAVLCLSALALAGTACSGASEAEGVAEEDDSESALNGVSIVQTEHSMESSTTNWAPGSSIVDRGREILVWLSTPKLPTDGYDVGFVKARVEGSVVVLTAAPLAPPTGCATNAFPTHVRAWYSVTKPAGVRSARVEWAPSAHKRRLGSACDRFAGTPRIGWATSLKRETSTQYTSAKVADDQSVIVSTPHDVWSVAPDGAVRWNAHDTNGSPSNSDVEMDAANIYVTRDGLYALRRADGGIAWKVALGQFPSSPARAADGTLYVGTADGLVAVTPTGTKKWTKAVTGFRFARPFVRADGNVMILATAADDTEDRLYAIRPDGTEGWKTSFPEVLELVAVGTDGSSYLTTQVGIGEKNLTRVLATGQVTAGFAHGNWFATPTADGGLVTSGWVKATKIEASGAEAWQYFSSPPTSSSTRRWEPQFARPVVTANGHVYVAPRAGPITYWGYASPVAELDAEGNELSRVNIEDPIHALAVTPQGKVYAVGESLYGIVTSTP